jgi:hypothetical protein
MFRAIVRAAFEATGRGSVLGVEITDGMIHANDKVTIATLHGDRTVVVRSVEFIDIDIGKPSFHSLTGLVVETLPASDVTIGGDVRAD